MKNKLIIESIFVRCPVCGKRVKAYGVDLNIKEVERYFRSLVKDHNCSKK